jgi:hypothetical protein
MVVPAVLGLILLPLAAATSYWAFFSQHFFLGLFLLILSLIPLGMGITRSFAANRRLS